MEGNKCKMVVPIGGEVKIDGGSKIIIGKYNDIFVETPGKIYRVVPQAGVGAVVHIAMAQVPENTVPPKAGADRGKRSRNMLQWQ